jgi:hypothetical protein
MKTYKHLYSQVCDWDNLFKAYRDARRGKRDKVQVYSFEFYVESISQIARNATGSQDALPRHQGK